MSISRSSIAGRWARVAIALVSLALSWPICSLASGLELDSSTSPARCIASASGSLSTPADVAGGAGGVVRVRMTFVAADKAPSVEVFFDTAGASRRDAVVAYVTGYRMPCLNADEKTFVATQEFRFNPFDERSVREDYDRLERVFACVAWPKNLPQFPRNSVAPFGVVFAKYTFSAADRAPTVEVFYDGSERRFSQEVRDYVRELRMSCAHPPAFPLAVSQTFRFADSDLALPGVKEIPLRTFVGSVARASAPPARFDFETMGCPFSVEFEPRQPHLDNAVTEVGPRDINRREFVEWLKVLKLDLPKNVMSQVLGSRLLLSVPCMVLDLT